MLGGEGVGKGKQFKPISDIKRAENDRAYHNYFYFQIVTFSLHTGKLHIPRIQRDRKKII